MGKPETRELKTTGWAGQKLILITHGNSSVVYAGSAFDLLSTVSSFLPDLQKEIEALLNVAVLSANVTVLSYSLSESSSPRAKSIVIYFVHKPREKTKVVHLPEFEPDARL